MDSLLKVGCFVWIEPNHGVAAVCLTQKSYPCQGTMCKAKRFPSMMFGIRFYTKSHMRSRDTKRVMGLYGSSLQRKLDVMAKDSTRCGKEPPKSIEFRAIAGLFGAPDIAFTQYSRHTHVNRVRPCGLLMPRHSFSQFLTGSCSSFFPKPSARNTY